MRNQQMFSALEGVKEQQQEQQQSAHKRYHCPRSGDFLVEKSYLYDKPEHGFLETRWVSKVSPTTVLY